ncbi:MAG: hypothetical protein R2758_01010 [Bacteroidales bacterium]
MYGLSLQVMSVPMGLLKEKNFRYDLDPQRQPLRSLRIAAMTTDLRAISGLEKPRP